MKLTKKSIALITAGTLSLGAISLSLMADGGKSCGERGHGYKSFVMGGHGFMGKNPDRLDQ